ncbi:putative ORFan [Tupanvirus deep ocean]|uniref:ORFan n=2 Tax=Tupanvirus TaxID=2094720 RepID=A0AC62A711_9VIRU|nr:putative ORFan [Tupanvirus deep ocean]QKU33571.1 putative ORFan [Tupanvirus deep ocean]
MIGIMVSVNYYDKLPYIIDNVKFNKSDATNAPKK